VTGFARSLVLDLIQVPLAPSRYGTLAFVGILPFCIVQQRSRKLALARELLTNCRVGALEPCYIHCGLIDAVTERGQFCPVRDGHRRTPGNAGSIVTEGGKRPPVRQRPRHKARCGNSA
jgi:hypothetical protein